MFSYHQTYQFFMGTKILVGNGSVFSVGSEVKALRGSKVLIVTDKGVKNSGIVDSVFESLRQQSLGYVVFDQVQPNPSVEVVEICLQLLKEEKCNCIVAIGGGSALDTAKAVGILATNSGKIADYEGRGKFSNPPLDLIAIPTTVGTGSEVTMGTVITDNERKIKMVISGMTLGPRVAILDPGLLTSLPPHMTASTGMDALTHAIEGYVSRAATPITDALNLHAIKLIAQNLRAAYANSNNLDAMGNMLVASTITGMAFTNSKLGIVHSLSHVLGAYLNIPHGMANAILLPVVMDFNWIGNPAKFAEIAQAMGEEINTMTVEQAARKASVLVRQLAEDIKIPKRISEIAGDEKDIETLAKSAYEDGNVINNPRKPTYEDVVQLYKKAW